MVTDTRFVQLITFLSFEHRVHRGFHGERTFINKLVELLIWSLSCVTVNCLFRKLNFALTPCEIFWNRRRHRRDFEYRIILCQFASFYTLITFYSWRNFQDNKASLSNKLNLLLFSVSVYRLLNFYARRIYGTHIYFAVWKRRHSFIKVYVVRLP